MRCEAEAILFEARAKRPRPHLDDKILTVVERPDDFRLRERPPQFWTSREYAQAARGAADFLLATMRREDGTLLRRYRDGDAAIAGMLDDYAFFVQGLLDLYEATFDFRYLDAAIAITEKQRELAGRRRPADFFASAHEDAARLMRIKDDYDGAEPSGNSVALMNLLRLYRITGREEFETSARKLISAFQTRLAAAPFGMPQMLAACEFDIAPPARDRGRRRRHPAI